MILTGWGPEVYMTSNDPTEPDVLDCRGAEEQTMRQGQRVAWWWR